MAQNTLPPTWRKVSITEVFLSRLPTRRNDAIFRPFKCPRFASSFHVVCQQYAKSITRSFEANLRLNPELCRCLLPKIQYSSTLISNPKPRNKWGHKQCMSHTIRGLLTVNSRLRGCCNESVVYSSAVHVTELRVALPHNEAFPVSSSGEGIGKVLL